jgi:hypothetical protein
MNRLVHFIFKRFPNLLPLFCGAFAVSCAHEKMYSGPTIPDDQLATLEATVPMWLVSVDGHHISSIGLHDTVRLKILPGTHTAEVSYNSMAMGTAVDRHGNFVRVHEETWSKRNFPITFNAKAGYRYVAHPGRIGASDWEPFITESLVDTNSAATK